MKDGHILILVSIFLLSGIGFALSSAYTAQAQPQSASSFDLFSLSTGNSNIISAVSDYSEFLDKTKLSQQFTYTPHPDGQGHLPISFSYSGIFMPSSYTLTGTQLSDFASSFVSRSEGDSSALQSVQINVLVNESYQRQVESGSIVKDCSSALKSKNGTVIGQCKSVDQRTYSYVQDWRMTWKPISDVQSLTIQRDVPLMVDVVPNFKPTLGSYAFDIVPRFKLGNAIYDFSQYAWFNNTHGFKALITVNTTGTSGSLTNMPYLVNNSLGIISLNSINSTPTERDVWSVANISAGNNTQHYLYYDSPSDFQVVNGSEDTAVPFELENGSVSFNTQGVWRPRNYTIVAHFGEGGGQTTTADSSGYGNTGTLTGAGVIFNATSQLYGNFITHQGAADQFVDFGDTASIVKGNTFTASIWFRPDKSGGGGTYQSLFDKGTNTGVDQFFVRINPSDQLEFAISGTTVATSSTLVNIGQWNFAVLQYDGTNGKGWLNGKFVGSTAQAMTIVTTHLKVGGDTGASGMGTFLGSVDEFRLSSTVLSTDEINQTYLEGKTRLASLGAVQNRPISTSPFFGSPNDTYQGPVIFPSSSQPYSPNQNISFEINITNPNSSTSIDTVIVQVNGTNFTNKGPPINPGSWHNLNLRIYNISNGEWYINFTSPPSGSYVGLWWVNDTGNNQNQSVNISASNSGTVLTKITSPSNQFVLTFAPNGTLPPSLTYNQTFNEYCYSNSTDSGQIKNFYLNGVLRPAGALLNFIYAGGSNHVDCDILATQNFTNIGDNDTFSVANGTLPSANLMKFINGIPGNLTQYDTSNVTISGNGTTNVADFENLNWTLYAGTQSVSFVGNILNLNMTKWFLPGTYLVALNTSGNQNYTGGGNNSMYIVVQSGLSPVNTTFNSPIFETNWTIFNSSVFIADTAGIINVTGYLTWNGTNQSFDSMVNNSNLLTFYKNLTIPLINTKNNTSYGHNWNFSIQYTNGSMFNNGTSNSTQSVFYGFNFTSLASNKNSYSQADLANFTAMSINKFFNPAVNETVTLNMNGTTLTNTSWNFNWTWTGPAFNNAFQFANVPFPLQSLNSTVITVNATYSVQFGTDKRSNSGLGSIRLTILRSAIGQCGTANYAIPVIGLHEYNETTEGNQTQDIRVNMTVDGNLLMTSAGSSTALNSSFELVNNTDYYLCLDVGNTMTVNGELRYTQASGGQPRSYFFQNAQIQNGTVAETKLFVSHNDAPTYLYSTSLKDSANNILTGYIIQAQHDYLQNNTFETVNMMQTDNFGTGNMWLQPNNIYYKFVIMKNGTIFGVINPLFLTCTVSTSCQLNLIIDLGNSGVQAFRYVNQIASNCNYNNATLTLSCNWADPTGVSKQMCLNIQEYGYVRPIQTAYNCVNTASGGTSYTFASYNGSTQYHYQLQALLAGNTRDNSTVVQDGFIQNHGPPVFGASGLVLGFIVIGTIAILGLFSPIIGILMIVFALGILSLMGFVDIGVGGVGTIAAVGLLVFWFIRRGG